MSAATGFFLYSVQVTNARIASPFLISNLKSIEFLPIYYILHFYSSLYLALN